MMKIIKIVLATVGALFLSIGTIEAQVSPTVSTKYSTTQIDEMHKTHRIDRPRDISPSQEMSSKFSAHFPNARAVEWEQSNALYEVEFEIGRDDYTAYYDMDGNLVMYKCEMRENQLPAIVRNAALAKHPNFRFEDVDKIVKGSETVYKVELEKGKLDIKMVLKHDGTILSEYVD